MAILFTENWSSGEVFGSNGNWGSSGNSPGENYVLDTDVKNEGAQSLRFMVDRDDNSNGSSFRSEVSLKSNWGAGGGGSVSQVLLETEYWVGFAIRLDPDWVTGKRGSSLHQIHGGSGSRGNMAGLRIVDQAVLNAALPSGDYDSFGLHIVPSPNNDNTAGLAIFLNVDDIAVGKWSYWVYNFKLSATDSTAFLKYWLNGTVVLDRTGTNVNDSAGDGHVKFGIYKSRWSNQSRPINTGETPRKCWVDSIRIGDSNASFNDVDPKQTVAATAPTVTAIGNHTTETGTTYTGPTPSATGTTPFTWSLVANPTGMTIDTVTGIVTWDIPTTNGSPHTVTIRATNSADTDDESWDLTVSAPPITPVITPLLLDETVDDDLAYTSPTPTATGTAPLTWSLTTTPSGMTIDSSTGVRSWPAASVTSTGSPHTVVVKVENDSGNVSDTMLLTVTTVPRTSPGSFTIIKGGSQRSHSVLVGDTGDGLELIRIEEGSEKSCDATIDDSTFKAINVAIAGGGTGYSASDVLTLSGGTKGTAATLTVDSVSSGVIDGISITVVGDYTVVPSDAVSVTGGGGSGATFNMGWGNFEVLFKPHRNFEGYAEYKYVEVGAGVSEREGLVRIKVGNPKVVV